MNNRKRTESTNTQIQIKSFYRHQKKQIQKKKPWVVSSITCDMGGGIRGVGEGAVSLVSEGDGGWLLGSMGMGGLGLAGGRWLCCDKFIGRAMGGMGGWPGRLGTNGVWNMAEMKKNKNKCTHYN